MQELSEPVTQCASCAVADAQDVVRAFLQSMDRRDLAAAQGMLSSEFQMQFPGARPISKLSELVAWASNRYATIRKTFDGFEGIETSDGSVVYCRGTLSGVWPDGGVFEGVRFIDRFEVSAGKIRRQDVWNDLAEVRGRSGL